MNAEPDQPVTLAEATRVWARIGCLSFGGPAAQIALMHKEVVEDRKWLSEDTFLNALNFCMLLPGPEAMQLATYAGWRLHGTLGGLIAGLLFVLPGAIVIFALSALYAAFGKIDIVEAAFLGIKAAVLVIVIEALLRIAKRALSRIEHWLIAAASFIGIFFFAVPFPLIVVAAGVVGFALRERNNDPSTQAADTSISWTDTLKTATLWLAIWLVPLAALWLLLGPDHVLSQIGLFFSKLAVVTFGGAYAVLAYMAQAAVETHGWLSAGEMLDGLGLAETTPGPLILVTEFVGYLGAARSDSTGHNMAMGLAGAGVTLWATFAPCFAWIFTGAPYITCIAAMPGLKGALQAITAAVVGVILNLSIWFALHVLAPGIEERWAGAFRYWVLPDRGVDWVAIILSIIAGVCLLGLHLGVLKTLGIGMALGILAWYAGIV